MSLGKSAGGDGGGGCKGGVCIPTWSGMPDKIPLVSLRWEDLYRAIVEHTGEQPSKEYVIAAFESALDSMGESIQSSYDDHLTYIAMDAGAHMHEDPSWAVGQEALDGKGGRQ